MLLLLLLLVLREWGWRRRCLERLPALHQHRNATVDPNVHDVVHGWAGGCHNTQRDGPWRVPLLSLLLLLLPLLVWVHTTLVDVRRPRARYGPRMPRRRQRD